MEEKGTKKEKAETQKTEKEKKKAGRPAKWMLAITVVAVAIIGTYVGIALYYQAHFLPNSSVNGILCDNMTVQELTAMVEAQIESYSLRVTGRDFRTGESGAVIGELVPAEIGMSYVNCSAAVQELLATQNEWMWPAAYMGSHRYYNIAQGVQFDRELLERVVKGWDACREENMIAPADAYISEYREELPGYEIIPETEGTTLKSGLVMEYIEAELYAQNTELDLEEKRCYDEASVKQTDKVLTETVETANQWLRTAITYDWNGNEVILDHETLHEWITIEEGKPLLDGDAVEAYVKKQAKQYDTYGKKKNFVTTLGIEMTLNSPNYGWKTDTEAETEALLEQIHQGAEAFKEPAYGVRARAKGSNDVGNSYIEADLTHQHVYVYQDGEMVFETDCVSGKMNSDPGCVTPPGIFGLTYKTTNAVLRGATYETPVSYWMPFYGNYGMHDATWRVHFGGTIYMENGSHGCINLPLDSAATIYGYVSTGFPVICYYYEVDPLPAVPTEGETLTAEQLQSEQEPTITQPQEPADGSQEG